MKQKRCVVISGGDFSPVSGLDPDDFVIACDRGYAYCERLGLRPDLMISDFDSYDGPVLDRFASEKDDTDTMLAVRYAIEHGFHELLLCCALGGRLDHLIANLQSLVFARKHGLSAVLLSEDTEIRVLEGGSLHIPRRDGWSSFPLGVSNTWAGEEAVVSVKEGILLIVLSRLPREDAENS